MSERLIRGLAELFGQSCSEVEDRLTDQEVGRRLAALVEAAEAWSISVGGTVDLQNAVDAFRAATEETRDA